VEVIPIQRINEAYERTVKSDVRYRFVIDIASLKQSWGEVRGERKESMNLSLSIQLGRVGVCTSQLDYQPPAKAQEAAAEIEEFRFGAVWFPEGAAREALTNTVVEGMSGRCLSEAHDAVSDVLQWCWGRKKICDRLAKIFVWRRVFRSQNRQILLKSRRVGMPWVENFEMVESPAPELGTEEVLTRTLFLSLDPDMRGLMNDSHSYLTNDTVLALGNECHAWT
jgi:hypothetical protein